MQTFNTVRLEDKLLFPDDMVSVVSVVSEVPVASATYENQYAFLKNAYKVIYTIGGAVAGTQVLQSGKIYKCKSYVHIDPISGTATTEYKWTSVTFAENGKLMACTNDDFTYQENAIKDGGGWSVIIHWEDPIDILNGSDPAANAVWMYTVIVRKRGTECPKTIYDGDIVGYSSVRNQYKSGVGFVDFIPEEGYKYNLFAVTRYGVATGLDDSGGSDVDWDALRKSIWAGTSGLSLGATIPVTHDQYGTLTLQVVSMRENDTSLVDPDPQNPSKRSVVFMAYNPLPRSAYDVKELEYAGDVQNPGDNISSETGDKCSTHGHCLWSYSNLRQWLNQDEWAWTEDTVWNENKTYGIKNADGTYTPVEYDPKYDNPAASNLHELVYMLSNDVVYNIHKCYYTLNSGEYKPVATPLYPSKVSPVALGYYEASWKWRPRKEATETEGNRWDLQPQPFAEVDPTAGYSFNDRALPGFLCGFPIAFKKVLATVKVNTITDPYYFIHGPVASSNHQITNDKVFIPSYRELIGNEPPGIRNNRWYMDEECYEGKLFEFYDPKRDIPDMSKRDRSLIKLDFEGGLCGYYVRSIGTKKSSGAKEFVIMDAANLWMTSVNNRRDKPELGQDVMDTRKCAMTVEESYQTDTSGNRVAPGIVWCVVIG